MTGVRWRRVALLAVLALAAANFAWQLGSSSYYVDEVLALRTAFAPLSGLLHAIRTLEISPPGYFLFLHEWTIRVGSGPEWVTRLPSVICGVALVAAVYWLASLLSDDPLVPLLAAGLLAISPFALEYAQRAQEYVFLMLGGTVALGAAITAERAVGRRQLGWMLVASLAAALSLWLHYTAGLLLVPLTVWVVTRKRLTSRQRAGYVATIVVAGAILIPVLARQYEKYPDRSGVAASARVTGTTLLQMLEVPFEGRVDSLRWLGVTVTLAAFVALLLVRRRAGLLAERKLVVWVAAGAPLALIVLSLFGGALMLTRYAAVAAPLIVVVIATAVAAVPRVAAVVLLAGALIVSAVGLRDAHRASGLYIDARAVVHYIRQREHRGDGVISPVEPGISLPLGYYGVGRLHNFEGGSAAAYELLSSHRHRVWIVEPGKPGLTSAELAEFERPQAELLGYRLLRDAVFPATTPLGVFLLAPRKRAG